MAGFFSEHYDVFRRLSEKIAAGVDQDSANKEIRELIQSAIKAISFSREEYDAFVEVAVDQRGGLLP